MRILADQDIWQTTVDLLRDDGHDLITAREAGLASADDATLLQKAVYDGRLLLTRDKDFGTLVFLEKICSRGVIFLRISPSSMDETHAVLLRLIENTPEEDLRDRFCVVAPGGYRVRKLPPHPTEG